MPPQWVWFDDSIALVTEVDEDTDFCELRVLMQNPRRFQGKVTWSLSEEATATSLSNTMDLYEHKISEIRPDIFIVDDGDEDYQPSSDEESDAESELDELLIEYNQIKGISFNNDKQFFDLVSVQNNHLHREYDYMKNDLTQGDQESTFIQPTIDNWSFANHFLTVAYYLFAIVLLLFLYQHFSMKKIYSTVFIVLLIGLYPYYIVPIERFLYFYAMYMYNFIRAEPVK